MVKTSMTIADIPKCDHCGETVFSPCLSSGESRDCVLRSCREAVLTRKDQPKPAFKVSGSGVESRGALKPTNPKDAVGIRKAPLSVLSGVVLMEMALGNMEGAMKYGRHNWRKAGIRYSVYYDAVIRHLMQWWEGEDVDPDSGLSHVTKAMCSLMVLRDAMIHGMVEDDRPPKSHEDWMKDLNVVADALVSKYPNPLPAITEKDKT